MEYHRRSLWNRIWENDSLDSLSQENYARDVLEERRGLPWREICHGVALSVWKGIQWLFWSGGSRVGHLKRKIEMSGDDEDKEDYDLS